MGSDDWFRRTSWTTQDAAAFQERLQRSRSDSSKAQYLRIQALHLAQVGNHEPALALIEQLLRLYPVPAELASSHLQRAESYAAIGSTEAAIGSFQKSLAAQAAYPNIRSNVALSFAWFIVLGRHGVLYCEVEPLLTLYEEDVGLLFPVQRFKCAVVRALLASEQGRKEDARRFADEAWSVAGEKHSGLRYYSKLGLVESVPAEVAQRLAAIGGRT